MNWKRWLTYDPYKKLYSLIGGRPWTFIWRDLYHGAPYVIQLLWFNIGLWVGINFGWQFAYIIWGVYTFGFIEGHFHWGKGWIKGQRGD